jgi:hypothetical protein
MCEIAGDTRMYAVHEVVRLGYFGRSEDTEEEEDVWHHTKYHVVMRWRGGLK